MWSNITKRIIFIGRFKSLKGFSRRNLSLSLRRYDVISNGILKNSQTIEIPRLSIPEFVFSRSEQFSDLVEYECPITKRSYTYGQVRKRSKNISKMLRKKLGLDRRDAVLVLLQNIPEFPIAVMGCLEADLIVSTANCMYTPEEIARQLRDSQAKLIITSYELYSTAQKASEKLGRKLPIICIKTLQEQSLPRDTIDFEEISTTVLDVPDLEPPNPDDVAILPYSSGTTGLAKGVRLSHYNIVSNLLQVYTVASDLIGTASGNYQETTPTVLPFFHIYGFTITTLLMMLKGVRALTLPRFQPDTYIQTFKDYKINFVYVAPPLLLFLTMHPEVKSEYLRHLTFAISGAAPLGSLDEQRFIEKAGKNVLMIQAYGLTETSPVVASNTRTIKNKFLEESKGSIGHVLPNTEVKIVKPGDAADTPLGPMESGELLVRGPQVMQGYHNNPKATDEIFSNGWLRTGDLAHYNEHGFLYITDRVKELIKVKGFQVPPAELEELLRDHPSIADAAVIGIPDPVSGEVPRAYIKLKEPVEPADIDRFINDKVAKYKRLDGGIEFVKEIPKNAAGKILRRELKQRYLQEQNA